MQNIIFSDIDGVLNDNSSYLCPEIISNFKRLVEENEAKVVLITSRQGFGTKNIRIRIIDEMSQIGISNVDFVDPNFEGDLFGIPIPSRVLGIIDYLKNNRDCNYVILDDEYHNDYKLLCLNFYKTSMNQGLRNSDLVHISLKKVNMNNFKNVNYYYRQLGEVEQNYNNLIKVLKKVYDKKK